MARGSRMLDRLYRPWVLFLAISCSTVWLNSPGDCLGVYGNKRLSYYCTGFKFYNLMLSQWNIGTLLEGFFKARSFECESDYCASRNALCSPENCGNPCVYACEGDNNIFSWHILYAGVELPSSVVQCVSEPCTAPNSSGLHHFYCKNIDNQLPPDPTKIYTLRVTIDVPPGPDDTLPAGGMDHPVFIVAGRVDVGNCVGWWKDGTNNFVVGVEVVFEIILRDSGGFVVNITNGISGTDLDVSWDPSIASVSEGDANSIRNLGVQRQGDTGRTYITFRAFKAGEYQLSISAPLPSKKYIALQDSPFPFSVGPGAVDVPSCKANWLNGNAILSRGTITLRIQMLDVGDNILTGLTSYDWNAEVLTKRGDSMVPPPPINSAAAPGNPGNWDIKVTMSTAGYFLLLITSNSTSESVSGSPFQFQVLPGEFFVDYTIVDWKNQTNLISIATFATLRILARDVDRNPIVPPGHLDIVATVFAHDASTISAHANTSQAIPPSGIPVIVELEDGNTGYYLLKHNTNLTGVGTFRMQVQVSGSNLPNTPFVFIVIPGLPSGVYSVGEWLKDPKNFHVGEKAAFIITLFDDFNNSITTASRGGNKLESFMWVTLIQDADDAARPVTLQLITKPPTDLGTQELTFTAYKVGHFLLNVGTRSATLHGSPFSFDIAEGSVVMSKCEASWVNVTASSIFPTFDSGSWANLAVIQKDIGGNLIKNLFRFTLNVAFSSDATISTPSSSETLVQYLYVTEGPGLSPGSVMVTFLAEKAGRFQLHVGNGTDEIHLSPFAFNVLAGNAIGKNSTGGWAGGLSKFKSGETIKFVVTHRDAFGNSALQNPHDSRIPLLFFTAKVFASGGDRTEISLPDLLVQPVTDPYYTQQRIQFSISDYGSFAMEVYWSVDPFPTPALSLAVETDGFSGRRAASPFFWEMYGSSSQSIPSEFGPEEMSSSQIQDSPFSFWVVGGEVYVPGCNASGPGLSGGVAGETLRFTIFTFDKKSFPYPASIDLFGVSFSPVVDAKVEYALSGNFSIDVQYRIQAALPLGYYMAVKSSDSAEQIHGSPFRVNITAGPLSIQNCTGEWEGGTPFVVVGKLRTFIITQMDAFGNLLFSDIYGVHDFQIYFTTIDGFAAPTSSFSVQPSPTAPEQILVTFSMKFTGTYLLLVGDPQGSIKGSPFKFSSVSAQTDEVVTADNCSARITPTTNLRTGDSVEVVITSHDSAGKAVKSSVALNFTIVRRSASEGQPTSFVPDDLGNGTYVASIKMTAVPRVTLVILLFGNPIPGSPFTLEVGVDKNYPRAVRDVVWTWMDVPFTFNVLSNDFVENGAPIFRRIDTPTDGHLQVGMDGVMVYTPEKGFVGVVDLAYDIEDSQHRTASGEVEITVSALHPLIRSLPDSIAAVEDQPMPAVGGLAGIEVASLDPTAIVWAEFYAKNGRVYPAADMSMSWMDVTIISETDSTFPKGEEIQTIMDITGTENEKSNRLCFSARLPHLNVALKALQYMGNGNFNGEDTVILSIQDSSGKGDSKSMKVFVQPVNDSPYVVGPSIFTVNMSSSAYSTMDVSSAGVRLFQLAVGDPDENDTTDGIQRYALAGILQVDSGMIQMTLPRSGKSASYRAPGAKEWLPIPADAMNISGQGIRFSASVQDWNTALSDLMFKSANTSTQKVGLSLVVEDMGNFGCFSTSDCNDEDVYSIVAQAQVAIMIYDKKYRAAGRLRAFAKFILYAIGGIIGLLAVWYLATRAIDWYKLSLQEANEMQEEPSYKMTRVYNPLWAPNYQNEKSAPIPESMGATFDMQQEWKIEPMFSPPPQLNSPMINGTGGDAMMQPWGDIFQQPPFGPGQGEIQHTNPSRARFSIKWQQVEKDGSGGGTYTSTASYGGPTESFAVGDPRTGNTGVDGQSASSGAGSPSFDAFAAIQAPYGFSTSPDNVDMDRMNPSPSPASTFQAPWGWSSAPDADLGPIPVSTFQAPPGFSSSAADAEIAPFDPSFGPPPIFEGPAGFPPRTGDVSSDPSFGVRFPQGAFDDRGVEGFGGFR